MKKLSVAEVGYLAHALVRELMDYDEPIPDFDTRYPHKLEACLEQPFQQFDGHKQYPTVEEKSAILFYSVIKNHPFVNGNKRMAVAILLVWLFKNNFWVKVTNETLYEIAIAVAESPASDRNKVLKSLQILFRETTYKKKSPGSAWLR